MRRFFVISKNMRRFFVISNNDLTTVLKQIYFSLSLLQKTFKHIATLQYETEIQVNLYHQLHQGVTIGPGK